MSAGFDYEEDGAVHRVQLTIPRDRFGITPDEDVKASKAKFTKAILDDMEVRTASAGDLLKNFDLTHKPTRRKKAEKKLTALKTFLPELDVPEATQQYLALMTSLDGSLPRAIILRKL